MATFKAITMLRREKNSHPTVYYISSKINQITVDYLDGVFNLPPLLVNNQEKIAI